MCHSAKESRKPNYLLHEHLRDTAISMWIITNIVILVTKCESVYINFHGVARHVTMETELGCFQMLYQNQSLFSFRRTITNDDPFISGICSRWSADI